MSTPKSCQDKLSQEHGQDISDTSFYIGTIAMWQKELKIELDPSEKKWFENDAKLFHMTSLPSFDQKVEALKTSEMFFLDAKQGDVTFQEQQEFLVKLSLKYDILRREWFRRVQLGEHRKMALFPHMYGIKTDEFEQTRRHFLAEGRKFYEMEENKASSPFLFSQGTVEKPEMEVKVASSPNVAFTRTEDKTDKRSPFLRKLNYALAHLSPSKYVDRSQVSTHASKKTTSEANIPSLAGNNTTTPDDVGTNSKAARSSHESLDNSRQEGNKWKKKTYMPLNIVNTPVTYRVIKGKKNLNAEERRHFNKLRKL